VPVDKLRRYGDIPEEPGESTGRRFHPRLTLDDELLQRLEGSNFGVSCIRRHARLVRIVVNRQERILGAHAPHHRGQRLDGPLDIVTRRLWPKGKTECAPGLVLWDIQGFHDM